MKKRTQRENKGCTDTGRDDKITSGSCLPHIMAGKSFNVIISPPSARAGTGSDQQTDRRAPQGAKNTGMKGETDVQERQEGR